jgi:hypothetical protein
MMITRINMSPEEKEKRRQKATCGMRMLRQAMSPEEIAKSREKETHERNRQRLAMSPEEIAMSRQKATDGMRTFRQAMSPEEIAKSREKETHERNRQRLAMSPGEKTKLTEKETIARKRQRRAMLKVEKNDAHCIKEAKKNLHRTQDSLNPHKHKSIVCVICDQFIIGTEAIHYLSKNNIIAHERRLSVESYERYYDTKLKPEVISQYMINDGDLKHLLLSPQSRNSSKGYTTCSCCFSLHATKHDKQKIASKNLQ